MLRGVCPEETGLKADFVEATVDQAPDLTPGRSISSSQPGEPFAGCLM